MSFEEELVAMLQAASSVTSAVGDRIWPVAIRLNPAFPAITYARDAGDREYALDANVVRRRVTLVVRCWAKSYPDARRLADEVSEVLDRNTSPSIDVVTVRDGADVWLDGHDVFGCTLVVEMEMHI